MKYLGGKSRIAKEIAPKIRGGVLILLAFFAAPVLLKARLRRILKMWSAMIYINI